METEIKLRIDDPARVKRQLARLGFSVSKRRVLEINIVFDTPQGLLRRAGKLLRLRRAGSGDTITFKGPPVTGRYKSREEVESEVADGKAIRRILEDLGYKAIFRYEKYRTEYSHTDQPGSAMLDETPIGVFLELEGPPRWIDSAARQLGRSHADYITASYGSLYLAYCAARGIRPSDMVFARHAR